MRKMALFVEGQTNAIFVRRLLEVIAGKDYLRFEVREAQGKLRGARYTTELWSDQSWPGQKYHILIVNSGSDESVISDVLHNYDGIVSEGFHAIAAISDVRPKRTRDEMPDTIQDLYTNYLKVDPIRPSLIFATMETEAWFLSEYTHFERIDNRLTLDIIRDTIGCDPSVDDMETRSHPSWDLHQIYDRVGLRYGKQEDEVKRTVNALDCDAIYFNAQAPSSLVALISVIDDFLAIKQ